MVLLLAVMALVIVVAVALMVGALRQRPRAASRAARYARSMGLPLPPEMAPWVERRLRRRVRARIAGIAVAVPVFWLIVVFMVSRAPAAGSGAAWHAWLMEMDLVNSTALLLIAGVGMTAGGVYDILRARPRGGARTAARLREAVPPGVTWWARAIALGPAALWAAALVLPRGSLLPGLAGLPVWVWLAAAVGASAVAAGVERLQLAVLRMPLRAGDGPGELAFEAAFRVETVLVATSLAPAGPIAGLAFDAFHAARAAAAVPGGWERWQALMPMWPSVGAGLVMLALIPVTLPRSRRRFQGRYLAGSA